MIVGIGATITLLTITDWSPASWLFAGYMLAISVLLTTVITGRRVADRAEEESA